MTDFRGWILCYFWIIVIFRQYRIMLTLPAESFKGLQISISICLMQYLQLKLEEHFTKKQWNYCKTKSLKSKTFQIQSFSDINAKCRLQCCYKQNSDISFDSQSSGINITELLSFCFGGKTKDSGPRDTGPWDLWRIPARSQYPSLTFLRKLYQYLHEEWYNRH